MSRAVELKKVEVEFHPQLNCLNSLLQLLVLPRLVVHRSIGCLENGRNVEFCLVRLSYKEDKGDRSLGALVNG